MTRSLSTWPLICWLLAGMAALGCSRPAFVPIDAVKDGPATPATPALSAFADLYGDQGGEPTAPADASASTPLRSRKADTFFKLSNPKFEPVGKKPFPYLSVDYERLREGTFAGQSLIVRTTEGHDKTYLLFGRFTDRAGKIEIDLGIAPPGSGGPPKNAELYLTRQEHRYGGGFVPTFKVSNSVILGTYRFPITQARDWTPEEAAKLRLPPPEGPRFNVHPEAGRDTPFAGDTTGGAKFRYAEPAKAVLGFDYGTGEWDKEACLGRLLPVYDAKQPIEGAQQRVLARDGYAVGGLIVKTKRYVNGVRVVFFRRGADGKLDAKDSYTSDWIGPENVGTKEVKLESGGGLVIGVNCQQGAILNAIALVVEQ